MMFYEIVVAPKYTEKGLEVLRGKSKTLRILEASKNNKGKLSLRQIGGGWLAQDSDDLTPEDIQFNVMSDKTPQENELTDAQFAWLCVKLVKSNAIVIAKNNCMLGMGSGQPNRLESLRIATRKAGDEVKGAALASDAFFPFAWNDAVEEACQSGVSVIAEPGGSIRNKDAVECCNKYGVSIVFTNTTLQALNVEVDAVARPLPQLLQLLDSSHFEPPYAPESGAYSLSNDISNHPGAQG